MSLKETSGWDETWKTLPPIRDATPRPRSPGQPANPIEACEWTQGQSTVPWSWKMFLTENERLGAGDLCPQKKDTMVFLKGKCCYFILPGVYCKQLWAIRFNETVDLIKRK